MSNNIAQLFKTNRLRQTPIRESLLNLFCQVTHPLSHADILRQPTMAEFDRVTLYRTLDTLQKAGILHKILGQDGIWRFGFHGGQETPSCGGNHCHFLCGECQVMTCLPDQPLPWVTVPAGAVIHSKQLVVRGLCATCASKLKEDL